MIKIIYVILLALLLGGCEAPQPIARHNNVDIRTEDKSIKQLNAEETRQRSMVVWNRTDGPKIRIGIDAIKPEHSRQHSYENDKEWLERSLRKGLEDSHFFAIEQDWPDYWLTVTVIRYNNYYTSDYQQQSVSEQLLSLLPFGDSILRSTLIDLHYQLRSSFDNKIVFEQSISTRLELCTVPAGMPTQVSNALNISDYQNSMLGRTLMANINQGIADVFARLSAGKQILAIDAIERDKFMFNTEHDQYAINEQLNVLFLAQGNPSWQQAKYRGHLKITNVTPTHLVAIPVNLSPKSLRVGDLVTSNKPLPWPPFRSTAPLGSCQNQ